MDWGTSSETDYDHYIRIPSDLFEDVDGRPAPTVTLPMSDTGRSAGFYPPPRPLFHEEPWTLQQKLLRRCRSPLEKYRRRHQYNRRSVFDRVSSSCDGDTALRQSFRYQEMWQQQLSHPPKQRFHLARPFVRKDGVKSRMQAEGVADLVGGGGVGGSVDGVPDAFDDSIDLVARANTVRLEPGAFLPVIQSTQCAIHSRSDVPERRLDLLYTTSCHGGKVVPEVKVRGKVAGIKSLTDSHPHPLGLTNRGDHTPRMLRDGSMDVVGFNPRAKYRKPAKLPEEGLTSKDVVMTWLKHGSAPQGEPHFPDITQPNNKVTQKQSMTKLRRQNHSAPSE